MQSNFCPDAQPNLKFAFSCCLHMYIIAFKKLNTNFRLRKIASSETEDSYRAEVQMLRSLSAYKENADHRNWLEKSLVT